MLSSFLKRFREEETSSSDEETSLGDEEMSQNFEKHGSQLLEELITSFGGGNVPIRSFSAVELIRATKNFDERLHIFAANTGYACRGSLQGRQILVKKFPYYLNDSESKARAIRDIVMNSQLSHLKNVLKLLGCCLQFEVPALVYEYSGTDRLSDILCDAHSGRSLSWRSRLKIAVDIATVVLHLHIAFPRPYIHRNVSPDRVIVDQNGVAKMFDFSLCIPLPPGEFQVEDSECGTFGYPHSKPPGPAVFTQKTDVYSLGMLLLVLITGVRDPLLHRAVSEAKYFNRLQVSGEDLDEILDPKILAEVKGTAQEQQLQDFLLIAFRCIQYQKQCRPEMSDAARELQRIERRARHC